MTLKDWVGLVVFAALFSLPVALYEFGAPRAWLSTAVAFVLALAVLFLVYRRFATADRRAVRGSGVLLMSAGVLLGSRSLLAVTLRAIVDTPPNQESEDVLVRLVFIFQSNIAVDVTTGLMALVFIFFGYLCLRLLGKMDSKLESSPKSPDGLLFRDLQTSPRVIKYVILQIQAEDQNQTKMFRGILRASFSDDPRSPMRIQGTSDEFFRAFGLFKQEFLDVEETHGHVGDAIRHVREILESKGLM